MAKTKIVKKASAAKHKVGGGSKNNGGGGAHMKVLNTVASLKVNLNMDKVERSKLSFYTGINGKSTIANALTKLKNLEWFDVKPHEVSITAAGMENADLDSSDIAVPSSNKDFHDTVKTQHQLKPKAIQLFDHLADGKTYEKKDVAEALGMKTNSTFANMLTNCKKCGIVQYDNKTIRLTDEMFPMEPRAE